jgi:hypothetical protein
MKVIKDYCRQQYRYGDSVGECHIELEDGDNEAEIIADYESRNTDGIGCQFYTHYRFMRKENNTLIFATQADYCD